MIQMPGLTGTERYLTVRLCDTLCHLPVITSIEEILTTRYISDHEKVGGWWDQAGILSIMSRTAPLHCVIHEFFIREIADQILEFLGSIISFCLWNSGQTGRGAKYIVGTQYLLFTRFALRQRYHLSWLSLTTWHQSLIISYQAGLQRIPPNLAVF